MIRNGQLVNPEVRIETTNICNAHCVTCPREKLTREITTMPYYQFEEIVWQVYYMGAKTISLFGFGEPLADSELPEKVALCSMIGLDTYIATNASLLTEELSGKLLRAGLKHIRFSVNGVGENYEKFHRGLKWNEVSHNIGEFMKINDCLFKHRCEVTVTAIPMFGETVDELVERWEPGGSVPMRIDHLEVWKPHNWTDGRKYRKVDRRLRTCGRPETGPIQVNADGSMMVCCFDYDAKMTIGNVGKNTVKDILEGKQLERIRTAHREGDLTGLPCETCDQLNILDESPLLYSSRNPLKEINRTSITNHKLEVS